MNIWHQFEKNSKDLNKVIDQNALLNYFKDRCGDGFVQIVDFLKVGEPGSKYAEPLNFLKKIENYIDKTDNPTELGKHFREFVDKDAVADYFDQHNDTIFSLLKEMIRHANADNLNEYLSNRLTSYENKDTTLMLLHDPQNNDVKIHATLCVIAAELNLCYCIAYKQAMNEYPELEKVSFKDPELPKFIKNCPQPSKKEIAKATKKFFGFL